MTLLSSYTNGRLGVEIKYPKEWKVQENEEMGIVIFSEGTSDTAPSLHITFLPVEQVDSLSQLSDYFLFQLQQMMPDVEVKTWLQPLAKMPGQWAEYTAIIPNMASSVRFLQAWTLKEGMAYSLTFNSRLEAYSYYRPLIEKCFDSFNFIAVKKPIDSICLSTYVSQQSEFLLKYPNSWKMSEISNLASPTIHGLGFDYTWKSEEQEFKLRLLAVVDELSPAITLDDYVKLHNVQLAKMLCLYENQIPRTYKANLGGHEARLVYYLPWGTKTIRLLSVRKNKGYALTLTSTAPITEEREIPLFLRLIENFSFLDSLTQAPRPSLICYEHMRVGISVEFPDSYLLKEGMGVTAMFIEKDSMARPYATNFNFLINEKSNQPLEEFVDSITKELENTASEFQLLGRMQTTLSGLPAYQLSYRAKLTDGRMAFDIKCLQRVALTDTMAYVLSFGALTDHFDTSFERSGKQIMDSFRLIRTLTTLPKPTSF